MNNQNYDNILNSPHKKLFHCKFFVWAFLILIFIGAVWFLLNISPNFQNDDEPQAVILDLPNLKTETLPRELDEEVQPAPDLEVPEQLPESPATDMKLSHNSGVKKLIKS